MSLKDKVCVITGGAKGIGFGMAKAFANSGAKIAIIDIDNNEGTKAIQLLKENGSDALFFCGDISCEDTLQAFVREVVKVYGKVDCLINNAYSAKGGIISDCSFDDFNYALKVGVAAPYMLVKLFLPYFAKGGSIVNIASTRAFMSQSDTESYSASKGAILSLTHALAVSLAGKVRVNCVSPGWIDVSANFDEAYLDKHSEYDKNQHLSKRVGKPEDIARAVMFLCDEKNDFINGENITVDGGMTKLMIYHNDYDWTFGGN